MTKDKVGWWVAGLLGTLIVPGVVAWFGVISSLASKSDVEKMIGIYHPAGSIKDGKALAERFGRLEEQVKIIREQNREIRALLLQRRNR